jgi:hypothetical protein
MLGIFLILLVVPKGSITFFLEYHFNNDNGLHCDNTHCTTFALASAWCHTIEVGENVEIILCGRARYLMLRTIYYIPLSLIPMTQLSPQAKIDPKKANLFCPLISLSI